MALQTGQAAPDFTLFNSEKKEVTLSALKESNVVILFFPMAFTSVCTTELCAVRDNLGFYNKANAKVLGISVDSPYTLAKFKEDQGLNFDLLSDFNKEVSQVYGALYPEFAFGMKGVSKRAAFVVDKKGKIRYAEVLENAGEQPHFGKIVGVLEEILLTV